MVCLNGVPSEFSAQLVDKYNDIAHFWLAGSAARQTIMEYNIEEPNHVIVADMKGKVDYIGNLLDPDCRTTFASVINKGSSSKPTNYLYNLSIYSRYTRKFDKRAKPEE